MEGLRRGLGRLPWLAVAVVLGLAGGCGGADDDSGSDVLVGATATDDPGRAFAPVLYFHPDERHLPLSGKSFVRDSTLRFANGRCGDLRVAGGRRELPRLTEAPVYRVRPRGGRDCRRSATAHRSDALTRPHASETGRAPGLPPNAGFYLDLADSARPGAATSRSGGRAELHGAAAWDDERPEPVGGEAGMRITYWVLLGVHAPRDARGRPVKSLSHEGDWERVDVLLRGEGRRWKPVAVRLRDIAGYPREIPWGDVERERAAYGTDGDRQRTHPVLHAALGSHTLQERPGARTARVDLPAGGQVAVREVARGRCRACPRMETALPGFPLDSQYWYGFGGSWGDVGPTSSTTGPLGPRPE